MKSILKGLLIVLPLLTALACGERDGHTKGPAPHAAIESLNTTIQHASIYQQHKEREIDSLRLLLNKASTPYDKWEAYLSLAASFRQTEADSAIIYAKQCRAYTRLLPDTVSTVRGDLMLANALATGGIFPHVTGILDSISLLNLSPQDKISYWKSSRLCYSYLMASLTGHDDYVDFYRRKYHACDDSLLNHLPQSDLFYRFIFAERLVDEHRGKEAQTKLEELLAEVPQDDNIYAMASYQLAKTYLDQGDFTNYTVYLAKAAESDIKGCVREGMALPTLANWMYEQGDLETAFRYMNYVLEDAHSGHIHTRTNAIASIAPIIGQTFHEQTVSSRNNLIVVLSVMTLLFVLAISFLGFMIVNMRKRKISQRSLESTSRKLEAYVGNFISLCSNYASRLEQLSKLVTRKISSGQSDDLLKMINNGKFTENNDEFYKLIDKALLDIFPDFVEQINLLLRPDQQIPSLTEEAPLTPELRIYAFIRLGVSQSTRIAQILGYSVNTVYAYRNRMRNRAEDRENFDRLVAEIGQNGGHGGSPDL